MFRREAPAALRAVSLMRADADPDQPVAPLLARHGVPATADTERWVRALWPCVADRDRSSFDFDDMVSAPWTFPDMRPPFYDVVFVDEAQDMNRCQIEFVKRLGSRFVCVGDRNQAIYAFRGACPTAMQDLTRALSARTMPMSTCFRCAHSIVREAQKVMPGIRPAPACVQEGVVATVDVDTMLGMLRCGDYVLCRTTAPLYGLGVRLLVGGTPLEVKGDADFLRSVRYAVEYVRRAEEERRKKAKRDAATEALKKDGGGALG